MDVRTLCLGVLSMGSASGYEIKKRLENGFGHFYDASFGSIYPGQSREPDEPGNVEINPVFHYVDTFVKDEALIAELKDRYARGDNLGDGHVKAAVIDAINELLDPMRERRAKLEGKAGDDLAIDILHQGTLKANKVAEETLWMAKEAMGLGFWKRELR